MSLLLHSLEDAFLHLDEFCSTYKADNSTCNRLRLVCEELITNLAKYTNVRSFELEFDVLKEDVTLILRYVSDKYDIFKIDSDEQNRSLQKRGYGGLGLFLVKSVCSSYSYEYNEKRGVSVITAAIKNK